MVSLSSRSTFILFYLLTSYVIFHFIFHLSVFHSPFLLRDSGRSYGDRSGVSSRAVLVALAGGVSGIA